MQAVSLEALKKKKKKEDASRNEPTLNKSQGRNVCSLLNSWDLAMEHFWESCYKRF